MILDVAKVEKIMGKNKKRCMLLSYSVSEFSAEREALVSAKFHYVYQ